MSFVLKRIIKAAVLLLFVNSTMCFSQSIKFISLEVAPWSYLDGSGRGYIGIFPDVVKEIERRTGHDIEITMTAFGFARINRELISGRQDCTIIIEDEYRSEFVLMGETLFNHAMGAIAKKEFVLKKYSDLYGLVISAHKKLMVTEEFYNDTGLLKEFDVNYEVGLRKIKHGRVDAVIGAISTIKYLAKKNNMDDILGEPLVLRLEPVKLQCSINSENLKYMEDMNAAIKSIKADGTLDKIIANNI